MTGEPPIELQGGGQHPEGGTPEGHQPTGHQAAGRQSASRQSTTRPSTNNPSTNRQSAAGHHLTDHPPTTGHYAKGHQQEGAPRPSMSSLQQDIEYALQAADRMDSNTDVRHGSGSAPSASSFFTSRSSYIDFDAKSQATSKHKPSRYREKLARAHKDMMARSSRTTAGLLRPFKVLKWPLTAIQKAWHRRNMLPPTKEGRKILVQPMDPPKQIDERTGKPYVSNLITSSIYTAYDFFPRQLIVQFSKLANMYFLFVAILQMIPTWSATGNYTTIVPLCIFVGISMSREGYEDFNRHRNDKEENNRKVMVHTLKADGSGYEYVEKLWKHVRVGDIVRVLQNEWVPADIALLHSSGPKGQCSVETVALDGETTLKSREVPVKLQEAFGVDNLETSRALITTEDPNLDLFNFEGTCEILDQDSKTIPLGPGNVIYRGSALRNTASVLGVVVFTGKETKMQQNASKNTRSKAPKLQGRVNRIVLVLAAYVLLLSGFSTLAGMRLQSSHSNHWYFQGDKVTRTQAMMGFIIMFNTLIPLSLYVSMEICKAFQKFFMQNDIDMYDENNDVRCRVLTSSLNEELGQVSYVFSDKTGTLTDNIMLFRKMTVAGYPWIHDLDMYFEHDEDGYLFHKVQPMQMEQMNEQDLALLEQLARIPRRAFGGRLPGRPSTGRPSSARPSLGRPSLGKPSLGRPSLGRPSLGRPSLGKPSLGQPGGERPSSMGPYVDPDLPMPPSKHSFGQVSNVKNSFATERAAPRPSGVSTTTQWKSTAEPLKPQTTPSTLTMLEYMMTHPNSPFSQRAHFFLLSLALCHSASPEVDLNRAEDDDEVEIEQLDYQAASPDELALVAAARDLGYMVIDRQYDSITLRTYPQGFDSPPKDEVYKVLDTIEFSSSRKRMSNVVQFPDGRIMLFCKGADNVMIERLRNTLTTAAKNAKKSIHAEAHVRRSVEAQLANENRNYSLGTRPSLDMLIQRGTADASIYEAGRRSMQAQHSFNQQHQHADAERPSKALPRNLQNAISNATASAMNNATRTSASIDMNRASMNMSGASLSMARKSVSNSIGGAPQQPIEPPSEQLERLDLEEMDEREVLERTLAKIDEFSTEGLRTLLYCHRSLSKQVYSAWKTEYDEAKAAISDRQKRVQEVGEKLERDFSVTGSTAIEDKLQKGVPESIEKLRRANIRMWMLTGDKQETAVNIGCSCRLIKDYSTIIMLKANENVEAKVMAALEELDNNNIAHCVVVIDGQTLSVVEQDPILMSLFVDLGLRADSAIVCRASPAQKATIVKSIREREPSKTMLAIGDGANDIAMIQAADVGIGIAGREGLQAARSADFSIGQFRFLLKLLFVHGRWNYVRTCKYILSTFAKEFLFYMSQEIFQRYDLFSGTSVFESWSISMFNTLFTSLPVICVGMMDQDLDPATLIAVPELYQIGQKNQEFGILILIRWLCVAMLECVMISFISYSFYGFNYVLRDTSLYPIGVVIYSGIVCAICFQIQFITMYNYITMISILVVVISIGGYWLFNVLLGLVGIVNPDKTYYTEREFWTDVGRELCFWAIVLLLATIAYLFEFSMKIIKCTVKPSDTDVFQRLEKDYYVMRRLESESELELHQGWEYQDKMDHSWLAPFRDRWPGQPRMTVEKENENPSKLDAWLEKLRLRKPVNYDREIQEILERRQRETEA